MADVGIAELFEAVENGNDAKVKKLIDKGISPNSFKCESRITPLHYCVQVGDVQMFKLLLENKASLRKRDRWMDSVVHYACRYGNINILELALKENTRQQTKLRMKQQALISKSGAPLEKTLKSQKIKTYLLNLKGKDCKIPISEAIINGHISSVVMLFKAGAAIDIRDQHGKAPINLLFDLPSDIQNDMIRELMALDVNIKEQNNFFLEICKYGGVHHDEKIQKKINDILENSMQDEKEKWLELFLQHDCVAVVKILLEEPNDYTWNVLQSVLKKAVQCSNEEIVKLVLNEHTGIFADEDCIKLCIKNQSVGILKYLLNFLANMKMDIIKIRQLIFLALEIGNVDIVTVLCDQLHSPLDHVDIYAKLWVKLIKNKYEGLIKYLLNAGVKLEDDEIYCSKTPLTAAIESENANILKCIISAGAETKHPQDDLHVAITTQNIEIVKLVLTLPQTKLNDGQITRAAIKTKDLPFLKDLSILGLELSSELLAAVETKELKIVELVYNSGARFYSDDKYEIWVAVRNGSKDILSFLLKRCSLFKMSKPNVWTPLHEAVRQDNLEILKLLMKNMPQSDINISGWNVYMDEDATPLSLAVFRRNVVITNLLISAGADINEGGRNLYNAVVSGSEEIVSILLRAGIVTRLDNEFGLTMLHVAVMKNNVTIVKQLLPLQYPNINAKVHLSDGLKIEFQQKFGDLYSADIYEHLKCATTPIQLALRQNSVDIVQQLLNHGADVNALCEIDNTTRKQCTRSTSLSSVFWKERNRKHILVTLLYFSLSLGNLEAATILLEHGASESTVNSNGETALFGLTFLFDDREKVYQGVKILIENGANINHVNADGNTVLNVAVRDGNIELMKVLILENADISLITDAIVEMLLKSPSYMSDIFFCNLKIVHFILQHGYYFRNSKLFKLLMVMNLDNHGDEIKIRNNISKAQHTICEILNHMKSLGFQIQDNVSQLLLTSAKYDLQILGKYLLLEGCDVNVIYKKKYAHNYRNALHVALENCNFHFMKILLDAGTNWIDDSRVLNTVLKKANDGFNTWQYSKCIVDTFSIEDSFIFNEKNEENIASIIAVFDTILNRDDDFEAVFALDDFRNSAIAFSIEKNIPWAVEYFLKHDTLKHILHSEHIGILFDVLLGNFHISTAKILIDEFGTKLVPSNPNIVQSLYLSRYGSEEEKFNLTQWLFDKGHNINCQADGERMSLSLRNNCNVLKIAIDKGYFKIANLLLIYTYPDGIMHSKAEGLIVDVINCEEKNVDDSAKRTFIKELLKCITLAGSYGNLLQCAVSKNDFMLVKMLLEGRYKINEEHEKDMLSFLSQNLINASKCHFVEIMEELINAGAELKFEKGANILHYLCALPPNHICNKKCFKMLKILVKGGAMTNMEDENGKLPMHHAISSLNYDALKLLVEDGRLIVPFGPDSELPMLPLYDFNLYNLCNDGQTERVVLISMLLLKTGKALVGNVPPEVINDVIVNERAEVMFLFSKYTERLEYRDSDGNTALHIACLHIACKQGSYELLAILLDLECEVNAQNNDGKTPLLLACEQGKYDFIKLLVQHGAKPDVSDSIGITPIHMAIISQSYEAIFLLLNKPCNVNKRTKSDHASIKAGSTPLVTVLTMNTHISQEIAEKLIYMGADLNICNTNGDTPLHIAVRNRCKETLLQKLLTRSLNVGIQNSKGWSALHLAVKNQEKNIVQIMLKEKYDVNSRIYDHSREFPGYTALHIAVDNTNVSLVEMLLKAGSNIFEKDVTGKTGMDLCKIESCMTEKLPLWSVLLKAGGSVRRLTPNRDFLKVLHNSNLFDLLIESGCIIQVEGHHLLEPGCSLLEEISNKQQQPLSLMRLAGNTVRTNIRPNAFYSSNKLPLPESIQRFICFDDSEHDVNQEVIKTYSLKFEEESNLHMQSRSQQRNVGTTHYYSEPKYDYDAYDDDYYDHNSGSDHEDSDNIYTGYDSDNYYHDSDW